MDSWDTANLVLDVSASCYPSTHGYLISNNRYKRKLYLYSLLICVANIGMALGSPAGIPDGRRCGGRGEARPAFGRDALLRGVYLFAVLFLQYFFEYLQLSGRERQLCSVGAFSMTGLLLLLTLASPWTAPPSR